MPDNEDFYRKLRGKIRDWLNKGDGKNNRWAEYIMCAPDLFHLLCKLALDKDVYVSDKVRLAAAIAYFVSPFDLVPEALLGPAGYVDDVAVAAYVLNLVINNTDPEVIKKHWAGESDVLELVKSILNVADEMVGSGLWMKIKGLLNK